MADWSTPRDIQARLRRQWERGALLVERLAPSGLFPLELRLKRPDARAIAADLGAVVDWAEALRTAAREEGGFELRWQTVRNRVHGRNDLPVAAIIPTLEDALKLLGRQRDAARFDGVVEATRSVAPELMEWLRERPLTALEHAEDWPRLLAVVDWFRHHPSPGIYLRQLDIPRVDTKFIEAHRRLLAELLDRVLPPEAIDSEHTGVRGFEARYGLQTRPSRLRLRLLDPDLARHGLTDITAPVAELARFDLTDAEPPLRCVFITENEINGLAFPAMANSAVIFGLGYAVEQLARLPWLQRVAVHYWGDLDSHGLAILDRLLGHLPHAEPLLMDRATLEAHRELWGEEPRSQRCEHPLERLPPEQAALYQGLLDDAWAPSLRLEQERIRYGWLEAALNGLKD